MGQIITKIYNYFKEPQLTDLEWLNLKESFETVRDDNGMYWRFDKTPKIR